MTTVHYDLDPSHSTIGFSVRHMMVTTQRGQFHGVTGSLDLDRDDWAKSRVTAVIDVATIDTHQADRDQHLRSPEFLDAATHPTMTFTSRRVALQPDGRLAVEGDLSIRGVTRPVVLDSDPISPESKDPFGMIKVGASASTKIRRKEFGLVWNAVLETGGVAISDEVSIQLDLQFQRKP